MRFDLNRLRSRDIDPPTAFIAYFDIGQADFTGSRRVHFEFDVTQNAGAT